MKCSKCGAENPENSKFCENCGSSLDNTSFFKKNKVLVFCLIAIIAVCAIMGTVIYMNLHSNPTLTDYGISEFTEGDQYNVSLIGGNGTPLEGKLVELIVYNNYGGSTIIDNYTDTEGNVSFNLDFLSGSYKIDVNYVDVNGSDNLNYQNITGLSKEITIKDGPSHEAWYTLSKKYSKLAANDINITVNSDSYDAETLSGSDKDGNVYNWWGASWFHQEDVSSGVIDVINDSYDGKDLFSEFDNSEWDKSSYSYEDIYVAHTPEDALKDMFKLSDLNGDGVLTGDEIKYIDYRLKHSQYAFDGSD